MKLAIYKRGKYSKSLFVALAKEEIAHLFGSTEPNNALMTMDGTTLTLRAVADDLPGTKITRTPSGFCMSKSIATLGLGNLHDFASSIEVETEWRTDNGVASIKANLPAHFLLHEPKTRRRRATAKPASAETAAPPVKTPEPPVAPMGGDRLRAMLDLLNETAEHLSLRLAVENNRVVAFRTVEIPV